MNWMEQANCADLPPQIADKYFGCNSSREAFLAQTAKSICAHCVVVTDCREAALNQNLLPRRGIIGGVSAGELRRARGWRRYEQGQTEHPPRSSRPAWLAMTDAAQRVEQQRLEGDQDELAPEL